MVAVAKQEAVVSQLDIFVVVYLLYGVINVAFIHTVAIDQMLIFQWMAMLGGYILSRNINNKTIIAAGLSASGVIQAVLAYLQYCGYLESNHRYFDVTGAFGNPGQLGGYLAVCFVVAVGLLAHGRRRSKTVVALRVVATAVIGGALFLTDSRAGWIAAAIGATYCAYVCFPKIKGLWAYWQVKTIVVMVVVVAVVALYTYKKDSADGRVLIWRVTADMIKDAPLAGHGVGTFGSKYMYFQGDYFAGNPDSKFAELADNVIYPYNEFLHVWAEQGIVGLALLLLVLCSVMFFKSADSENRILKSALIALLVFSCFSYPASVFPLLFLFAVLLGAMDSRVVWTVRPRKIYYAIALLLCLGVVFAAYNEVIFYKGAGQNMNRKLAEQLKPEYDKFKNNARFMNVYSIYVLDDQDIVWRCRVLQDAAQVIPSSELLCDLGDSHLALKQHDAARECYATARNMIPSRIVPTYCLFKLYQSQSDSVQAREAARLIVDQKVKFSNTQTIRIKTEAREYLGIEHSY